LIAEIRTLGTKLSTQEGSAKMLKTIKKTYNLISLKPKMIEMMKMTAENISIKSNWFLYKKLELSIDSAERPTQPR